MAELVPKDVFPVSASGFVFAAIDGSQSGEKTVWDLDATIIGEIIAKGTDLLYRADKDFVDFEIVRLQAKDALQIVERLVPPLHSLRERLTRNARRRGEFHSRLNMVSKLQILPHLANL